MDIVPAAGTGPWLVVAVVLGVLGLVLAGAVTIAVLRRRGPRSPATAAPPTVTGFRDDDLPGFLERPPGSAPALPPGPGWTALSSPPVPVAAVQPRARNRWTPVTIALAVLGALLLLGAAISAVAAAVDDRPAGGARSTASSAASPPASSARGADVVSGDLAFGGVVLERHVVGVTATYPHVTLTRGVSGLVAHVELPTYNCLATTAPADPIAARCAAAVPEYADLPAPALQVSRTPDGGLRLDGRFPTYTRPNGSPAVRTGRVYELVITAGSADGRQPTGEVPATGELRLGAGRAAATGVSVLGFGG
jgi:hypothetical protein